MMANITDGTTDTATVEVPAEHYELVKRAVALLARGEQWVVDNVTAAVGTFEAMFKDDEDQVSKED